MHSNSSSNSNPTNSTTARERWKLLSSIFFNDSSSKSFQNPTPISSRVSKRSHQGFNLFPKQKIQLPYNSYCNRMIGNDIAKENREISFDLQENEEWISYDLGDVCLNVRVTIPQTLDFKNALFSEYSGFLNTGNICIWPAEEVLAHYCLKNFELFRNKSVCEVGGGMCSLSGLAIAAKCHPRSVLLTDGNPSCIKNILLISHQNTDLFSSVDLCTKQMLWDSESTYRDTYDVVICADCTFDKSTHPHLLHVLRSILKKPSTDGSDSGLFLMCAPHRGDSLNAFISLVETQGDLCVELLERYDETVWSFHEDNLKANDEGHYAPDTHYPLMVKIYWKNMT